MKTSTIAMTALAALLILALAVPVLAEDPAQADATQTTEVTQADSPASDPLGSFLGFFGIRHDIRERQEENRNLSQDLQTTQQEIHENWWENIGVFNNLLGNRQTVRSAQQDELALRQENLGLRENMRNTRLDIKENPENKTAGLEQIAGNRETLHTNWQEINATHDSIEAARNLSLENRSVIHENNLEDLALRQENNATREAIYTNRVQNQQDRQLIRNERKNGSTAGSS